MIDREFLKRTTSIDPDVIDDLIDQLHQLGVRDFKLVQELGGKSGTTIEIKDQSDRFYYVVLSEYGYVEIIREGSPAGKIIYMPLDD